MDTATLIQNAEAECVSGREDKKAGRLEDALLHFRSAAEIFNATPELQAAERDHYAGLLYDISDTHRTLRQDVESAVALWNAWLISGEEMKSRGRGMAMDIVKTIAATRPLKQGPQYLRTAAANVLGGLRNHVGGFDEHLKQAPLAQPLPTPNKSGIHLSPWGVIQLVILALILIFKISSCN